MSMSHDVSYYLTWTFFFFFPFFLSSSFFFFFLLLSSFFFFQGPDVQMPVIAETARVLNELGFPKDETKKFSYLSEALFCAMYNNDILPEEAFIFWSEDHETEYVNFLVNFLVPNDMIDRINLSNLILLFS